MVVLQHGLDFCLSPHGLLREAARSVRPGGYLLISGVNPWSTWGLRHYFARDGFRQARCISPNRLAERIKVPVLLAAGGEDKIAPIEHSRLMERALRKQGVPVETLYQPNEGHGFYAPENRAGYYTKLLQFLDRHLASTR